MLRWIHRSSTRYGYAAVEIPPSTKDLDEAEAELSRQEAERAMNEKVTEIEFTEAAARLSQAMAQQRTMEELRRRRG